MPVTGDVFVDELPGHVRIRVEGNDPTQPWQMVMTPQAAFNLALELRVKAEDAGHKGNATPVNTTSGAMPQRRPPSNLPSREGQGGPTSNVDGQALSASPARQNAGNTTSSPPLDTSDGLLGDDF